MAECAIIVVLQRYDVVMYPETASVDFYNTLATKVIFTDRFSEASLSLRGGFASCLLAYVPLVQLHITRLI